MTNWYDDIDAATLQRIKTYSAFCDYKSQNLMLQTLYEAMQKKIDENRGIAKDYADLQKQVKELKEGLAVGSTWNKALNSRNKYLEEERDKFRNMVFDKMEQLTKAREIIRDLLSYLYSVEYDHVSDLEQAEQFLKEVDE